MTALCVVTRNGHKAHIAPLSDFQPLTSTQVERLKQLGYTVVVKGYAGSITPPMPATFEEQYENQKQPTDFESWLFED